MTTMPLSQCGAVTFTQAHRSRDVLQGGWNLDDEGGFDEDDDEPQPAVSGASQPGASSPPPDATGEASAHSAWETACTSDLIIDCAMIAPTHASSQSDNSGALHEVSG